MPPPTSPDAHQLENVLHDLEVLQRWAEGCAQAEAECAARRPRHAEQHLGRAGGFAASAKRVAIVRATFDANPPDATAASLALAHGGPTASLALGRQLVAELRRWTAEETAEAAQDAGYLFPAQRHATGRAEAFAEVLGRLEALGLSKTP